MAKPRPSPSLAPGFDPVEKGFLDARGKLIEVAAFLDRADRHGRSTDYRVKALNTALKKISKPDRSGERAASILRSLSDPSSVPAAKAGAPAAGAWKKA